MKLMTKAVESLVRKYPLYSQDGKGDEAVVIAKFFLPGTNWTWYATEGDLTDDGDIEFFGLVAGDFPELGYFTLSSLEGARSPWGLKVERDLHWHGTIGDAKREM